MSQHPSKVLVSFTVACASLTSPASTAQCSSELSTPGRPSGVQVLIPVLSNDHFATQSVSDWDLVHFFQAVADMGSVDYARHTGTFLTQGSRSVPKDPSEGMKYFLQAAEAGAPCQPAACHSSLVVMSLHCHTCCPPSSPTTLAFCWFPAPESSSEWTSEAPAPVARWRLVIT